MVDWDEIQKLQTAFKKTQFSITLQKFSERNCIEILTKLKEMKLLNVLHTTDGKEYVTHQQVKQDIKNELCLKNGRISLVDLQQILNIDYSHVEAKCKEIVSSCRNISIVFGELIDDKHIDQLAEEINENLQASGFLKTAELSKEYNLPGSYIVPKLVERLGTIIKGEFDKHNKDVLFTDAFIARQKSLIRGMMSAATKPTSIQSLTSLHGFSVPLIHSLLSSIINEGRLNGQVTGGRSDKAIFNPLIYNQIVNKRLKSFFKVNNYIEYRRLNRRGISNHKSYIKNNFNELNPTFLKTVCLSSIIKDRIASSYFFQPPEKYEWIDVANLSELPSCLNVEDVAMLINIIVEEKKKKSNIKGFQVFSDTVVTNSNFSKSCLEFFQSYINEKANAEFKKCSILTLTEQDKKRYMSCESTSQQSKKKEEKNKKSLQEGKSTVKDEGLSSKYGTNSSREVKTKGKDKKRQKWTKNQECGDKENKNTKEESNSFMIMEEVIEVLTKSLKNCPVKVVKEVAEEIFKPLQKIYQNAVQSVFIKVAQSSKSNLTNTMSMKQNNRAFLKQLEDELNVMWNRARLCIEGLQLFDAAIKQNFEKYLLQSIGTDITNRIFLFNTDDKMTGIEKNEELTKVYI